jgi:hypothetical protein
MTILGYDILSCPFCAQLYKNEIIGSSNTFNSRYYSDGHLEGQFIPIRTSIIKCVNNDCEKFFNINEAKKIAQYDEYDLDAPKWENAFFLGKYKIGIKELEEALATGFCRNDEEEKTARTLLLRRYNDFYRKNEDYKFSSLEEETFTRNIERLIELHKNEKSRKGKLFLAELYREKSDFDSCIEILSGICNEKEGEKGIKEKIYSQAKVKDDKVFNVYAIAVKKEYKCNNCGDSLILFDLNKINTLTENMLDFRNYICRLDDKVFSAPLKQINPVNFYKLNLLHKIFKTKEPYSKFIANKIVCPICHETDLEIFNPELQNCIKCSTGSYEIVKWFN